jgi:hypothetical protein
VHRSQGFLWRTAGELREDSLQLGAIQSISAPIQFHSCVVVVPVFNGLQS